MVERASNIRAWNNKFLQGVFWLSGRRQDDCWWTNLQALLIEELAVALTKYDVTSSCCSMRVTTPNTKSQRFLKRGLTCACNFKFVGLTRTPRCVPSAHYIHKLAPFNLMAQYVIHKILLSFACQVLQVQKPACCLAHGPLSHRRLHVFL